MAEVDTVDGVAIADIATINGTAAANIEAISGVDFVTGPDTFKVLVEESSDLVCWWSPNDATAGNLTTGDVAMEVMNTGVSNPDIKARVDSAGDWTIVEDDIGSQASLKSAVEAFKQRRTTGE